MLLGDPSTFELFSKIVRLTLIAPPCGSLASVSDYVMTSEDYNTKFAVWEGSIFS